MKQRPTLLLIGIAYLGFVGLALPSSILGVAWPSIRASFGLSIDAVGTLLVAGTVGSLLASFATGPVMARVGTGRFLLAGSAMALVGLLAYVLAPTWWAMIPFGLLVGASGGALDAGLNVYFAENHGSRLMNWLHACFGVGSTLGPVIVTGVLNFGLSWRWAYVIAAAIEALVTIGFALTMRRWPNPGDASPGTGPKFASRVESPFVTLRLPLVWLGVLLFFLLSGTEIAAGQWPYSLFTEARSVTPNTAGLWMSIYWGSLTVGRIAFGIAGDRLEIVPSLRVSMVGIICGAVLLWSNVTDLLSFLGLALMGFAFAPLFPLLQLVTPRRVGEQHAANAIGFQTAAAGLGMGILPGLGGVLARHLGLEAIGPFLFICAAAMMLAHEGTAMRKPKHVA